MNQTAKYAYSDAQMLRLHTELAAGRPVVTEIIETLWPQIIGPWARTVASKTGMEQDDAGSLLATTVLIELRRLTSDPAALSTVTSLGAWLRLNALRAAWKDSERCATGLAGSTNAVRRISRANGIRLKLEKAGLPAEDEDVINAYNATLRRGTKERPLTSADLAGVRVVSLQSDWASPDWTAVSSGFDEFDERFEQQARLRAHFDAAGLNEEERAVIYLTFGEGMLRAEAARMLGVSEHVVQRRLRKAEDKLAAIGERDHCVAA